MMAMLAHRSATSDDVGGQDHGLVFADVGQQVVEAHALLRVEAGGRFVDDDQFRVAQQRLGDAEALAHAARETAQALVAHFEQIGLLQQAIDHFAAAAVAQAFEHGKVVEQFVSGHFRVDAEILRQVAQQAADLVFFIEHVKVAEEDRAGIAFLQGGNGAHQRRFAGAVGAEQAEHPGRDGERNIVQRHNAVGVGLGQIADT
jgi:hypothetical protein